MLAVARDLRGREIAFDTSLFAAMLVRRMTGGFEWAFVVVKLSEGSARPGGRSADQLDPLKFLSCPGLWIGLVIAAVFLFGAIRIRRYRGAL